MTDDQVSRYIDDLRRALRSHGAFDVNLLEEIREHLIDAVDEGIRRGLPGEVAAREAIGRCGPPGVVAAHVVDGTPRLRRRALLTLCAATVLASAFLSLSLSILRPPRANYPVWTAEAALFVAQSAFTIIILLRGGSPSTSSRALLTAGGLALLLIGGSGLYSAATVHFQGYRLALGALLIVQGATTIVHFRRRPVRLPLATLP